MSKSVNGKAGSNVKCRTFSIFYFLAGDPLTLVVSIDNQNIYGMHISECMVKDGLGWSEQRLINGEG